MIEYKKTSSPHNSKENRNWFSLTFGGRINIENALLITDCLIDLGLLIKLKNSQRIFKRNVHIDFKKLIIESIILCVMNIQVLKIQLFSINIFLAENFNSVNLALDEY